MNISQTSLVTKFDEVFKLNRGNLSPPVPGGNYVGGGQRELRGWTAIIMYFRSGNAGDTACWLQHKKLRNLHHTKTAGLDLRPRWVNLLATRRKQAKKKRTKNQRLAVSEMMGVVTVIWKLLCIPPSLLSSWRAKLPVSMILRLLM